MKTKSQCEIIIPTYYPGKIIIDLFKSIPSEYNIKIIDNGSDKELKKNISESGLKIDHIEVGDIGLGKSFNYALQKITTEFAFITQPDVILSRDCIKNLIHVANEFPNAAIVSPLYFDDGKYSKYDFYDLKISKHKKLISSKSNSQFKNYIPEGNICVEAINSTAFLVDIKKIKSIGGWDENFYTYLEDIDLCLRLRLARFEIIKTPFVSIQHKGFSSHKSEIKENINTSRIWNFTWSSIYFTKKHRSDLFFWSYYLKIFFKNFIKYIFNFLLNRKKKLRENKIKLSACACFFLKKNYLDTK